MIIKIFICAVTALSVSLILMTFSFIFISNSIDSLQSSLKATSPTLQQNDKASDDTVECLDNSIDFWRSRRIFLCMFINQNDFEEIEGLLLNLRASAKSGDSGLYAVYHSILTDKLTKLRKSESFSTEAIF